MGRRRSISPGVDAAVWVASGRWGPKRVKVTQCWAVLKAEDAYTVFLRGGREQVRPGRHGFLLWTLEDRPPVRIAFELRPNAVWRFGRVFFTCPGCNRRATRIYVPTEDALAACRRCWGLSYESRQENYKAGSSRTGWILSPFMGAWCRTLGARERRAKAAKERYAERREILGTIPAHPVVPLTPCAEPTRPRRRRQLTGMP